MNFSEKPAVIRQNKKKKFQNCLCVTASFLPSNHLQHCFVGHKSPKLLLTKVGRPHHWPQSQMGSHVHREAPEFPETI